MQVGRSCLWLLITGSVFSAVVTLPGCRSTPTKSEGTITSSTSPSGTTSSSNSAPSLQEATDKLLASVEKPTAPFHVSFKKVTSEGLSYTTEADVSSDGITGKETDFVPKSQVGNQKFPASTKVRDIQGVPLGSSSWGMERTTMALAYLRHIGDAQDGVRYAGDEQIGGYDARRYDFDLTNVDSTAKKAMLMGGNFAPGVRKLNDYNVKGSAWIAKDDGRMVKFQYDMIMVFSNGENDVTHFEGLVTKK